jgi:hypothetical protein
VPRAECRPCARSQTCTPTAAPAPAHLRIRTPRNNANTEAQNIGALRPQSPIPDFAPPLRYPTWGGMWAPQGAPPPPAPPQRATPRAKQGTRSSATWVMAVIVAWVGYPNSTIWSPCFRQVGPSARRLSARCCDSMHCGYSAKELGWTGDGRWGRGRGSVDTDLGDVKSATRTRESKNKLRWERESKSHAWPLSANLGQCSSGARLTLPANYCMLQPPTLLQTS